MKISSVLLGLSLAVTGSVSAAPQDATPTDVPKVLQITVEHTKPYKGGMAHDKTESAFVAAFAKAKFPVHYIGMNSLSGKPRSLYMTRYASFAEWEKAGKIVAANADLANDIENAGLADGELLDDTESIVFTYDADLSYHPHSDLSHHRVYQITVFQVRPGHHKEWTDVVKMVKDAHDKMGDKAHWGMYETAFGGRDGTYIAITGDASMSVIDDAFAQSKQFMDAVGGEEGMTKLGQLFGEAVESSHSELFAVNPKQSYVSDDWIKEDSDFWKPKSGDTSAVPTTAPATGTSSR